MPEMDWLRAVRPAARAPVLEQRCRCSCSPVWTISSPSTAAYEVGATGLHQQAASAGACWATECAISCAPARRSAISRKHQATLESAQRIAHLGSWDWNLAAQRGLLVGRDLPHPRTRAGQHFPGVRSVPRADVRRGPLENPRGSSARARRPESCSGKVVRIVRPDGQREIRAAAGDRQLRRGRNHQSDCRHHQDVTGAEGGGSSASAISPTTTVSRGCPTDSSSSRAPAARAGSLPAPLAPAGGAVKSTWTSSSASTTRWATRPATNCSIAVAQRLSGSRARRGLMLARPDDDQCRCGRAPGRRRSSACWSRS